MIIILQDRENKRLTVQTASCHLQDCDMIGRCTVCRGLREKWWIGAVFKGLCPMIYSSIPSCHGARLSNQNTVTATATAPHNVYNQKIASEK